MKTKNLRLLILPILIYIEMAFSTVIVAKTYWYLSGGTYVIGYDVLRFAMYAVLLSFTILTLTLAFIFRKQLPELFDHLKRDAKDEN